MKRKSYSASGRKKPIASSIERCSSNPRIWDSGQKSKHVMKRIEIKSHALLSAYLRSVFSDCGRTSLQLSDWHYASLFCVPERGWPTEMAEFAHGTGGSPRLSSELLASELVLEHREVTIRADERYAKASDPWVHEFAGLGQVRCDECVVGVVHENLRSASELAKILELGVSLPSGLFFLISSQKISCASCDADSIVVSGVFDGEAFIRLSRR